MSLSALLVQAIVEQFSPRVLGMHGVKHWARVLENGRRLAAETGARLPVVELFAVFHDSGRWTEGTDPGHGLRGAEVARRMRGELFDLGDEDFARLHTACALHSDGLTEHEDVTVLTCWDADRLDLGRVGITPRASKLCTPAAKDAKIMAWAIARSHSDAVPAPARAWGVSSDVARG